MNRLQGPHFTTQKMSEIGKIFCDMNGLEGPHFKPRKMSEIGNHNEKSEK